MHVLYKEEGLEFLGLGVFFWGGGAIYAFIKFLFYFLFFFFSSSFSVL
jgi:hypothetical protein